jgi:hypothetical protein
MILGEFSGSRRETGLSVLFLTHVFAVFPSSTLVIQESAVSDR